MIKKCVAMWLATIICMILVPNAEASTWTLDLGKEAAESLTRDYSTLAIKGTGGSSTVGAELGEYTVLVFGRYNCYNTATTSRNVKAVHDQLGFNKGNVFLMDIENSYETIKEQQANFDGVYLSTMDVTSSSLYNTCYWEITKACTALGSDSGVLPAMVVLDSKGNPVYCSSNYETNQSMYLTLMRELLGMEDAVPVASVSASISSYGVKVGGTAVATATVSPSNASNQSVVWSSSNESVARVTESGTILGIKSGSSTITVTTMSGGKSDSFKITVSDVDIPVTGITLPQSTITLQVGDTIPFYPTFHPSFLPTTATNTMFTWSLRNSSVVDVSGGNLTALKAGTSVITMIASDGGYTAACTVNVIDESSTNIAVTGLSLNKSTLSLKVGDTSSLTATVSPTNATEKAVTWESSNTAVATVSSTGVVTGKTAGSAKITASTSNNKTSSLTVTVSEDDITVTGISLENTAITLEVGEVITVKPTISPSNASKQNYSWHIQNTAVLDSISFGVFEAKKVGVATITAQTSDGQFKASCTVTVVEGTLSGVAVTGIHLDKSTLSLNVGGSSSLKATISPETAVNQRVAWSSSAPSVATVSDAGLVTGKSGGTAIITATSSDGSFKATSTVTVTGEASTGGSSASSAFVDINKGDWFESFITEGVSKGYFSGYEDGSFRPDSNITMGEFYTMLCRYWGYDGLASESKHWASEFATTIASLYWIDEIPSDLDMAITREQVAEVVLRSVGAIPDFWADNPYSDTENLSAITLYDMGIMQGWLDEHGTRYLSPNNNISRAEFATVLFSLEHYMDEVSGVTDFRYRRDQVFAPVHPSCTIEYFQDVFTYMLNYSITEYSFELDQASLSQWDHQGYMALLSEAYSKVRDIYAQTGSFMSMIHVNSTNTANGQRYTISLSNTNFTMESLLEYENIYLLQMGYWAQELVDQGYVKASDSDYDKARYVYTYCAENFAYDTALNKISYTGYGLVSNGIGVCQAYVSVYNALCSIYGIDIYGVSGTVKGNHIWSYANLDGEWLYIDPTFGDPLPNRDYANYDYFALTRDEIEETHTFEYFW